MSRFMFSIVILLFLAIIFTPVAGQLLAADSSLPEPAIHLKQYSFDPLAVEPQLAASMKTSMSGGETFTALVQFSGPVHANWKEQVESAGVRLYGYIPDYAFIARTDYSAAESIRSLPFIRWVGGYHPAYAIDRELISVQAAAQGADDTLSVKTLPNTDLDALATTIDSLGGSVLGQSKNGIAGYLRIELPSTRLFDLARQDGVLWVERYFEPSLLNDKGGGGIMRADEIRQNFGLFGAGQTVAVADSGLDIGATNGIHPDFQNKVVAAYCLGRPDPCHWSDPDGHGTHVSGSVTGSGAASGANLGGHQYNGSGAGGST